MTTITENLGPYTLCKSAEPDGQVFVSLTALPDNRIQEAESINGKE